jgi:crotonobetainyl-CoA:carnitine CoA-transferase CaiB-like acyl-CoA transferase
MLNYLAAWSLNRSWAPARHANGSHQSLLPSQTFATCDGWLVIMVMKEKFWARLVERLGLPALADDPRFRTFADRLAHRATLAPILEARFREHTTAEWLERLRGQVPVAPVYTVAEALADEQAQARDMLVDVPHPVFGVLRQVGSPIKMSGVAPRYRAASALGADTADVLGEIGIGPTELARLRDAGVVA